MEEEEPAYNNMVTVLKKFYNSYGLNKNATESYYYYYIYDNNSSEVELVSDNAVDILSFCGIAQEEGFWLTWQNFVFWCEGVLILAVGSLGLFGNILATYILSSSDFREMQWTTFNYLLIGLSVFDLLFLTFSVPVHVFPIPGMTWLNNVHDTRLYCILYRFMLYPFSSVTYTAGVFVTIAMTIERFQAVCYPHYYRDSLITSTPLKRALKFIIAAFVAALILEIPKFLEVKVHEEDDGTTTCVASDLTTDATFVNWKKMTSIVHPFFTTTFIPIVMLFVMNTCIYRGILAKSRRDSILHPGQHKHHSASKLQAILIIICLLFVITHFPRLILAILAFAQRPKATHCALHNVEYIPALYVVCMETVSNLLIHINASSNLLIFSCTSAQFKEVFRLKFPWIFGCSFNRISITNSSPNQEVVAPTAAPSTDKEHHCLLMTTSFTHANTLSHSHQMSKAPSFNFLHKHHAEARRRFASLSDLTKLKSFPQLDKTPIELPAIAGTPTASRKIYAEEKYD